MFVVDPARHSKPGTQRSKHGTSKPYTALNLPCKQSVQEAEFPVLYFPGGHRTAVELVDPTGHAYPAKHAPLHSALPKALTAGSNHTPPGHAMHAADPARLYLPAGHTEAVAFVDPAGHAYPALQSPPHVRLSVWFGSTQVPTRHVVQDTDPAALYVPIGHKDIVGLVVPAGHAYPAGHAPLHREDVKPTALALYHVPAGHTLHDADLDKLYWPAGHTTAVALEDPEGHAYPAGHAPLQFNDAKPTTVTLNHVPPGHTEQNADPDELYWPAGHTNAVALVDPDGHAYPAGHIPLQLDDVKPTTVLLYHVPAGHTLHDADQGKLYLPAGHTEAVALVDPTGQAYPAGHTPLQFDEVKPTSDTLYHVPPGHKLQDADRARLYWPAGHTDSVALGFVVPTGQAYPAGHSPLHDEVVRPTTDALYHVPPGHTLQAADRAKLYWPAGHTNAVAFKLVVPAGQAYPAGQLSPSQYRLDCPAASGLYNSP
jgi:hypothetical protein